MAICLLLMFLDPQNLKMSKDEKYIERVSYSKPQCKKVTTELLSSCILCGV